MGRDAGDDAAVVRPRGGSGAAVPGASLLGLVFFLASLTVLFAASIVGYVVVRIQAHVWPPSDTPALPIGLWISTGLLLVCSLTIQSGLNAIRRGDEALLVRQLIRTLVVALIFVGVQATNWLWFRMHDPNFEQHLYGFGFYMLTGLHAAHVVGGVIALVVVLIRTKLGYYSSAYYPGVRHSAIYWHYLGIVWLVLLGVLLIP